MNRLRGYGLIEVLLVVMITGILLSVGVPAYYDGMSKPKVMEGFVLMSAVSRRLSFEACQGNKMPQTLSDISVKTKGRYSEISYMVGPPTVLVASYPDVEGFLTMTFNGDGWVCNSSHMKAQIVPSTCKL